MSADNGYVMWQLDDDRWVGVHRFMSDDTAIADLVKTRMEAHKLSIFKTLEEAQHTLRDVIRASEYGVVDIRYNDKNIGRIMDTPEPDSEPAADLMYQHIYDTFMTTHYTENTLFKVFNVLTNYYIDNVATDIINDLQNEGILFRERGE